MSGHFAQRRLFEVAKKTYQSFKNVETIGIYQVARNFSVNRPVLMPYSSPLPDSYYNEEQIQMQESCAKVSILNFFSKLWSLGTVLKYEYIFHFQLVESEVNPFVDEWENAEIFPAHKVFKKFGEAGMLGIDKSPGHLMYYLLLK